jgi:hypothetical protein
MARVTATPRENPKGRRLMKLMKFASAVTFGVAMMALVTTVGSHAYDTWGHWGYTPVPFYLNPQALNLTPDAVEAAVVSSAATWTTQSNASFAFSYAGRVNDTSVTYDGRNVFIFRHDTTTGGTLGRAYVYSSDGLIVESDVILNDGVYPYFTGTSGCVGGAYVEDIATHELGHALGMQHSSVWPATMAPYYTVCYTGQRTLQPDDIAGIESMYPPASGTNTAPTVAITSPANGTSVSQGTMVSFAGSATDTQDGNLTSRLAWTSSLNPSQTIGNGGSFSSSSLAMGQQTLTASVTDTGGKTGSSQQTITITVANTAPTVAISSPADGTSVVQGTTVSFSGSATDTQDGDMTSKLVWTSSLVPSPIGGGGSFSTATLPVGAQTVTASATDIGGMTSTSQRTITITASCASPTVTVSPSPTWLAPGVIQSYTATVTNNSAPTCVSSSFALGVVGPAGWTTTLSALTLQPAPGSSSSTTVKVTAPVGTPAGAYAVLVSATNSAAPAYSGSSSVTHNIISSLGVTISNAPVYVVNQTVSITAAVTQGPLVTAGASVTITVTKPSGAVLKRSTQTTNSTGTITMSFRAPSTLGTYNVSAVATKSAITGNAATTFLVTK